MNMANLCRKDVRGQHGMEIKSVTWNICKYVDKNTFDATFDSFGVQSQVAIAKARMLSYRVEGTPEVIINGKYRVSLKKAKTQARMLEIADFLIAKERAKLNNNAVSTANTK